MTALKECQRSQIWSQFQPTTSKHGPGIKPETEDLLPGRRQ